MHRFVGSAVGASGNADFDFNNGLTPVDWYFLHILFYNVIGDFDEIRIVG